MAAQKARMRMSYLPLRYEAISSDRRSELEMLDKSTLIDRILEIESQVIFDYQVSIDEVSELIETYETRRRVIDFVHANHPDKDPDEKRKMIRDLLVFVNAVRP